MVQYRRNFLPGGTYFFTVVLKDRESGYLTRYIQELRQSFRYCLQSKPFKLDAIVVLPDHLHCIWTLPANDSCYSSRWRLIKYQFTRSLIERGEPLFKDKNGLYNLWQRRFWEHTIRDSDDLAKHVDYIHFNPVKHGYANLAAEWPFSSFHQYVRDGLKPPDWGGLSVGNARGFGE